jgi:hypothetical protein
MESQLSPSARRQLDRFCRQYFQVQLDLSYPGEEQLRNDVFQQALYPALTSREISTPSTEKAHRAHREEYSRLGRRSMDSFGDITCLVAGYQIFHIVLTVLHTIGYFR